MERPDRITAMLSTSCDDLQSSIALITDIAFLEELLGEIEYKGQKTKARIVNTRIRKIMKEAA